jgi:F-type H+-transporting ATPase subunit a
LESITPQVVFYLFGLPIKSTIIATWVTMAVIIVAVILMNLFKPDLAEMIVAFLSNLISDIMNIDSPEPYLPLVGTLAIFITIANTTGIIPLLVSPTSDINTPIALSLVVFFAIYYYGIRSKGALRYFKELASPIFLLPLEIIGQISRTLSLSLRLFGNVLSGELIASILLSLVPLFVPLPMMGLSMLLGILQAYVFTALASVYIASAIEISENNSSKKKGSIQ